MFRIESYRRGFVYSSLLSAVDNVLAFVPSMLIAAFFGACTASDVYYYITGLLALMAGFFGNFSASVIIPEYMRRRIQNGPRDGVRFLNMIFLLNSALTLILVAIAVHHPVRAFSALSRFDRAALEENRAMLYWALPLLPLQTVVSLLNDTLHSHKFFTAPMLSSIVNRLLVIVALLLGHRQVGLVSVMVGLQLSFALQGAVLVQILRKKLSWEMTLSFEGLRGRVARNLGYSALGGIFSIASSYVPIFLFSGLTEGIVTGLNLAQRLMAVPLTFLGAQASAVLGVKLNELFAMRDEQQIRHSFARAVTGFTFLMALVAGTGFLFGRDIVAVLYQRGAFNAKSTAMTAQLFRWLCWALPFLTVNTFLARVFMAAQRLRDALICQVAGNVLQMALVYWAVNRWGGIAYPVALVAFYATYLLAMIPVMNHWFPFLSYGKTVMRAGGVLCLLMIVSALGSAVWDPLTTTWNSWTRLLCGVLGFWTFGMAFNRVVPLCPELNDIITTAAGKLRALTGRSQGGV